MGTGAQMLAWHPDFCAALVERGFQVIRFDNRDSGLSTHFTSSGAPNQLKMWLRPASVAVYRRSVEHRRLPAEDTFRRPETCRAGGLRSY
jgi:pimeloyl-ACP methyl ester carboxylesterase